MTIENIFKCLSDEDFNINIRPTISEEGKWSGDIQLSIMVSGDNPLDDNDYGSLMHFTKMICSSVPIMEFSSELRELAHNYVMDEEDNVIEFKPDDRGKVIDRTDNVVTISFGTTTKGTA